MDISERNRQIIQDALNDARPGETVNTDDLPLLRRADGKTPVSPLFTVPQSAATLWRPYNSPDRKNHT
jgi:hypothetical protein